MNRPRLLQARQIISALAVLCSLLQFSAGFEIIRLPVRLLLNPLDPESLPNLSKTDEVEQFHLTSSEMRRTRRTSGFSERPSPFTSAVLYHSSCTHSPQTNASELRGEHTRRNGVGGPLLC